MNERDRKMARENPARPGQGHRGEEGSGSQGGNNQGIIRDERGQEQPADKERAQRVHKTKGGQTRG
jgi:hypothetical protein